MTFETDSKPEPQVTFFTGQGHLDPVIDLISHFSIDQPVASEFAARLAAVSQQLDRPLAQSETRTLGSPVKSTPLDQSHGGT